MDSPPPVEPRFHLVLHQPEIPPNTGTAIRLAAASGAALHLIGPLGFRLDGAAVKRAGMDYREMASVTRHDDWSAFREKLPTGARLIAFTTKGETPYHQVRFQPGDRLLFGSEGSGLPPDVLKAADATARIPMRPGTRSLNLAMSVGIVLYEALRQAGYPDLE